MNMVKTSLLARASVARALLHEVSLKQHRPVRSASTGIRASAQSSNEGGPLAGIRVLDMTRILAGPYCTMILGDLGAEIIKVENPGGGDETRKWGPPFVGNESCYFLSVNRNKKSIAVNLKDPAGVTLIKQLSKESDVFVENFLPGKLDDFGLGYSDLKDLAPHLVYCSITGYGSSGPYRNRAGYDVIAASVGGLVGVTGPENGEPCKVGVAVTDLATGLYAHGAIMAALIERQKTGCGQKIECNLLSTQIALLVNLGSNYLNAGLEAKKQGTAHSSIVPYQAFKTADGYLTVGAGNNNHFEILCKILQLDHLCKDAKYSSNSGRVMHRDTLLDELKARFVLKTTAEWLQLFEGCCIPYGPINTLKEVFNDPQVAHSKIVNEMNHLSAGQIKVTGSPVTYSSSSNYCRLPPPTLSQHTDEVLTSILQLKQQEIDSLRKKRVIE